MPGRPFRILVLDDITFDERKQSDRDIRTKIGTGKTAFPKLVERICSLGDASTLEVYLSRDAQLSPHFIEQLHGKSDMNALKESLETDPGAENFLSSLDVLILDLGGVGPPREAWQVDSDRLPEASEAELRSLNNEYGGAGFYFALRNSVLRSCQAVVIVTQYDNADEEVLEKHLDPCCTEDSIPWTTKRGLTDRELATLGDLIESLYKDFSEGYVRFQNRGAIEFAAVHDLPVLIVGESGTGKEGVAKAIHRRWVQEKVRKRIDVRLHPVVINCGGLHPDLARSELFGHLKDSFTGAGDHRTGCALEACGITLFESKTLGGRRNKSGTTDAEDFRKSLERANPGKFERKGGDMVLTGKGPFGTLFLDEFGDLPFDVQILLLRFLESDEIQPHGFGGNKICGAKVRIIAATSDPRVAQFVGEELHSMRGADEPPRPLREDLMFRLAGQTVRAEGIAEGTAEQEVRTLVENQPPERRIKWEDEAIKTLGNLVGKKVAAVAKAYEARQRGEMLIGAVPVFGHWREVNRFITLVNAYVSTAQERGIRAVEPIVSADVVNRLWSPATVRRTKMGVGGTASGIGEDPSMGGNRSVDGEEKQWLAERFEHEGIVDVGTKEAQLLRKILERAGEFVTFSEVQNLFKNKNSFNAAVSRLRNKWPSNCGFNFARRGCRADMC